MTESISGTLFCECTNCTHRWTEKPPFVVTIRCPIEDCGSKNVEVWTAEDLDREAKERTA